MGETEGAERKGRATARVVVRAVWHMTREALKA
jgi:hypothetical protein